MPRLRLAGLLLDQKTPSTQSTRWATRLNSLGWCPCRFDILLAQGKADDAKAAFNQAWKAMDESIEYRRVVEAKLTALGASPVVAAASAASGVGAGK